MTCGFNVRKVCILIIFLRNQIFRVSEVDVESISFLLINFILNLNQKTRELILTLFIPMEISIKFDTVKSGWSIVYIEGLLVITFKNIAFLSMKIKFVLANSAYHDEIPPCAVFHLGLHCLSYYQLRG